MAPGRIRAKKAVEAGAVILLASTGLTRNWVGFGVAFVTALVIWWAFFHKTTCAAGRSADGGPCANTAHGRLGACHLAAHKQMKRQALWVWVRPGRGPIGQRTTRARSEGNRMPPATEAEAVAPLEAQPRLYNNIMLCTSVLGVVLTAITIWTG